MSELEKTAATLRDRLLDAAERLFAAHGVTGVSLRQISAAAGTKNNYAVQYHFGDIDGLVRAILERRAPQLDRMRGRMLTRWTGQVPLTVRQLIEIFHRPMFEPVGLGEPLVFARFQLSLLASPDRLELLDEVFSELPITRHLLELMAIANRPVPPPITWRRMQYVGLTVLAAGVSAYNNGDTQAFYDAAVTDAFNMASAALMIPVEDGSALLGDEAKYFAAKSTE